MVEEPLTLAALIVGMTALAFWLARSFSWATKAGASLLVIVFGAVVSNLGWVPVSSPVYSMIGGPITSVAIVWLLFGVNLGDLRNAGSRMLGAFLIAVIGTAVGAFVAFSLFGRFFPDDGWRLAGVMTGTYSGGGVNFVSVGRAVGLSGSLFAAATAADNLMTGLWVGATLLLPVWLARFYPAPRESSATSTASTASASSASSASSTTPEFRDPMQAPFTVGVQQLLMLGGSALAVVAAAEALGAWVPRVPSIVWLTTIALAAAQLGPIKRLPGALELGTLALHLFFAVIGIGSRVDQILTVGVEVFYFAAVVVLVHGLVLFIVARVVGLDVETTAVASQASVGGPSTAIVLAIARKRTELALPGAVVGLLGYALGTYSGLAVATILR